MTTYIEAIDIMYGVFKTAWDNGASLIVGYTPDVEYDEPDQGERHKLNRIFARLVVRNAGDGQMSMGSQKTYESIGVLAIQVLVPKGDNQGVQRGRQLATLVRDAYRNAGVGGEVWFINATIREQTPGRRWRRFNINVEYDFTEQLN